jgi:hypothetical protein
MLYSFICLVTGIYIGQEYAMYIPSVKFISLNVLSYIQRMYIEEQQKYIEEQEKLKEKSFLSSFFGWN